MLATRINTGFPRSMLLFVLHRCWWFGCVVEEDSVDAGDFGGDALYQVVDEVVGQVLDGDFDDVDGVDGADDAGPVEGAFAVFDAGGFEIRDDGEILPDFAFEAVFGEFFTKDGIGFADGFQTVTGDGAGAADA